MAVYRSGRSRRLVVEGNWQSPIHVEYRCTNEWPTFPNRYATLSEKWPELIEVRALGMAVGGLDQMGGRVSIELVTVEDDAIVSSLSTDGVLFS